MTCTFDSNDSFISWKKFIFNKKRLCCIYHINENFTAWISINTCMLIYKVWIFQFWILYLYIIFTCQIDEQS